MWRRQFIRYAITGMIANAFSFLSYVALTWLGLSPVLTISIIYPAHLAFAFLVNKSWSFNNHGYISAPLIKYLISYISCYLLNVIILKYFSGYLGFSHLSTQAVSILIFAVLLFLVQKYWVFKASSLSLSNERLS